MDMDFTDFSLPNEENLGARVAAESVLVSVAGTPETP
jgi:hypothetical protein